MNDGEMIDVHKIDLAGMLDYLASQWGSSERSQPNIVKAFEVDFPTIPEELYCEQSFTIPEGMLSKRSPEKSLKILVTEGDLYLTQKDDASVEAFIVRGEIGYAGCMSRIEGDLQPDLPCTILQGIAYVLNHTDLHDDVKIVLRDNFEEAVDAVQCEREY